MASTSTTTAATPTSAAPLTWASIASLKGPKGEDGVQGTRGTQWVLGHGDFNADAHPDAQAGDIYLDVDSGAFGALAVGSP